MPTTVRDTGISTSLRDFASTRDIKLADPEGIAAEVEQLVEEEAGL